MLTDTSPQAEFQAPNIPLKTQTSKEDRVRAEINQMLADGVVRTIAEICDRAGVYREFLSRTPKLKKLYLQACAKVQAKDKSGILPNDLRIELSQAATANLSGAPQDGERLAALICEAGQLFGFSQTAKDFWERTIDALDANYPGWRGYEVRYTTGKVA